MPTTSDLSPAIGPIAGGTLVTITGTGFILGETDVVVDGVDVPATADPSGLSLTFTTPTHAAGPVDVVVHTPGGDSTPALTFTYYGLPTISDLEPADGPTEGGLPVVVTGTGFVPGQTTVTVGGVTVPPTR